MMIRTSITVVLILLASVASRAASQFVTFQPSAGSVMLASFGQQAPTVYMDEADFPGVSVALESLQRDLLAVTGQKALRVADPGQACLIVGTLGRSTTIDRLASQGIVSRRSLAGKWEKFIVTTWHDKVVIAGSDKRGTIYGIYELSRQMGVSPWHWWADVPVARHQDVYVRQGTYTDGEPKVKYRGIFINDENPCMQRWARETFGGMNSKMYAHVYELILRLRGNLLWPAMWGSFKEYKPLVTVLKNEDGSWEGNDFNEDDPLNPRLADEYGVVIGTSHHEPMQRSQQEWLRHRQDYGNGAWNYVSNAAGLQRFFRDGIRRVKDYENLVTIGMRGDEDRPMADAGGREANMRLLKTIFSDQRRIIAEVTGRPARETPQVWTLYSELLDYYEEGLTVPDDVILMLCDDNWGDVRRVPEPGGRRHPGGYGMYYHFGYYGAPRACKWLLHSQIQHVWQQMDLAYRHGVDRLWMVNVGDIKPFEFPLTMLMDMAWNPDEFGAGGLMDYTRRFCEPVVGERHADEAARILNAYCKQAARVTAEMLDSQTYDLHSGEFLAVRNEFLALEAMALRLWTEIGREYRDCYQQLILFPVQAMANLYDLYYSVAMNRSLFLQGDLRANEWADRAERCYQRDSLLTRAYNHDLSGGKWNHMMDEVHIGYTSWHAPQHNRMPEVRRLTADRRGGCVFKEQYRRVVIEAEHYWAAQAPAGTSWTVIPDLGRTLSALTLMPPTAPTAGASLTYRMRFEGDVQDSVRVRIVFSAIMPFVKGGHRVSVAFAGCPAKTFNLNHDFNWQHCYDKMYPTGAARVLPLDCQLAVKADADGLCSLTLTPEDRGIVIQKIIADRGGAVPSYLGMPESRFERRE